MTDFTALSDADLADFVEAHRAEVDAPGLVQGDVLDGRASGAVVIERRSFGFAMLRLRHTQEGKVIPFLWLLYVDPAERGCGKGRGFVRELLRTYSSDYHMSLHCSGSARRRFFGRLGFVVEGRDGDVRHMTTNREHYRH